MLFQEIWSSYESLMKRYHWKRTLTITFWGILKFLKLKENSTTALQLLKFLIMKKVLRWFLTTLKLVGFRYEKTFCQNSDYFRYRFIQNDITQPTFQRRINVVSTLWINVEITLIWRWKWNKIRRQIFNVAQFWCNVSTWPWNNVGTTLIQRCFNLAST